MARINLNNGLGSYDRAPIEDATWQQIESLGWDVVTNYMDADTCERVPARYDNNREWLDEYLRLAPRDLVIG